MYNVIAINNIISFLSFCEIYKSTVFFVEMNATCFDIFCLMQWYSYILYVT